MTSKKKYTVSLTTRLHKTEEYTVEASTPEEAVELAYEADEPDYYCDPEEDHTFADKSSYFHTERTENLGPKVEEIIGQEEDGGIGFYQTVWLNPKGE
jgi:hypothetical protein